MQAQNKDYDFNWPGKPSRKLYTTKDFLKMKKRQLARRRAKNRKAKYSRQRNRE